MTNLDCVYMLVHDGTRGIEASRGRALGVYYSPPATNIRDCWRNAALWDALEGGMEDTADVDAIYVAEFRKSMKSAGWRAERVQIKRAWL